MPTLVYDLDNTYFQYDRALDGHLWRTERRKLPKVLPQYSYVESGAFATYEHFLETHFAFVEAGGFATMEPFPGATAELRRLRDEGWTLKVATHRLLGGVSDDLVRETTIAGLDRVGTPYDELHFVGEKHTVSGDVWADDKPDVLVELDRRGLARVAYAHAYNVALPGPHATSWKQMGVLVRAAVAVPSAV